MNTQTTQIRKQLISRKETQFVINSPLGSTIKFRRKQLNMTLEETAEDLSSVSYLSKLENNLIKPNHKYVKLLEKRLNTTFEKYNINAVIFFSEDKEVFMIESGITEEQITLDKIMHIDQVKGLEFNNVLVHTKNMSKNQKYIAYSRALENLIILE